MSGGGQRVARKAVSAEAWQTAPARAGPVAVPSPTEPPTAASLHAGPIAGPGGAGRATETPRVPDALQPVHRKRFSNAARPADLDSTRTLNASTDSLASPTSPVGLWKAPLGKLDYSNPGLGAAHSAPDLPSASAPAPSAQPNIDRPPALPGRPLVKKAAMTEAPIPAPVSFPSQPTQRPPIPQIPHSASSSTFNSFAGRTAPLSGPVPSPSMSSLASHAPSAARIPTQPAALESDKRERLELQRQLKLTQEAKAALEKTTRELREQLAKKSEEWLEKTAKTTKELETAGKLVDESNARLRKAGLAPGLDPTPRPIPLSQTPDPDSLQALEKKLETRRALFSSRLSQFDAEAQRVKDRDRKRLERLESMRKELEGCKLPRIGESDAILPKEGVPISNAAERRTDNESSLVAKPVPAAAPTVIKPAEPMATQLNVTPAIIPVTSVPAQSREETAPLLAEPSKEREAISLGSLPPSEPDNSLFSDFMREIDSKFAS